jgi:SIT4-associating protein SAP185/190
MFEGIDDSSDDESLNSYEGAGEGARQDENGNEHEHIEGPIEVEGKEVGRKETVEAKTGESETAKGEQKQSDEGSQSIVV